MASMFRQYMAIQEVPSDCSRWPPPGSGAERSNTPMLSSPRKPPWNTFLPSASLRFTHQVKFSSSFWKMRSRKARSALPHIRLSILYTRQAAQAWTGGLASLKAHSYAGICPLGCMYHSRRNRMSWDLAKSGSTREREMQWKARSQAAYQGYSHLSG